MRGMSGRGETPLAGVDRGRWRGGGEKRRVEESGRLGGGRRVRKVFARLNNLGDVYLVAGVGRKKGGEDESEERRERGGVLGERGNNGGGGGSGGDRCGGWSINSREAAEQLLFFCDFSQGVPPVAYRDTYHVNFLREYFSVEAPTHPCFEDVSLTKVRVG